MIGSYGELVYGCAKSGMGGLALANEETRLVLHVAEVGLRSTLVARLTLGGADVLTVREVTHDRPPVASRGTLILVTDDAGTGSYPGGAEAMYGDPRWALLVVLTDAERPMDAPPHLHHLEVVSAPAALPVLLDGWKRG